MAEKKKKTLSSETVLLLIKNKYSDEKIRQILAKKFPDKDLKKIVSFTRSGINSHILGKKLVNQFNIVLPIVKIN